MRFYPKQHKASGGIDLPARSMDVGILSQDGEILLHRNMQTSPELFRKAIAPSRADLVSAVACLFPWYGLADLCARDASPFVLGHALSMKAIHGGKAKNEKSDAQKIAVLLRGGLLPQAYVSPADLRATRDLLRRRIPLVRKRAELLPHVQQTNRQDHVPEMGKDLADQTNRPGGAERLAAPAGQTSVEVDRALIDDADQLLRALERTMVPTAQPPDANPLSLAPDRPGSWPAPASRAVG
jgi:hypothetical protein